MKNKGEATSTLDQVDNDSLIAEVSDEALENAAAADRPKFSYGNPGDILPC